MFWGHLVEYRGRVRGRLSKGSDDAVFIAGHAHMLCLERAVKCQSTETRISRHRVEAVSELSRGW